MQRHLAKTGRFFLSWRFPFFLLGLVLFILLFYAEENWRGAHDWVQTKHHWEAQGETFDFKRLIPPPVPDDQNLAALPIFKMEPDPAQNGTLAPLALHRACRVGLPGHEIPSLGNSQHGVLPDLKKIRAGIFASYAEAFKASHATNDALAQLDALYPFVADLRAAAATRKFCLFQQSYRFDPPDDLFISLMTAQLSVSIILPLHAVVAIDSHQPALALDDLKTNLKLASGLMRQPILVSGLCAVAMTAVSYSAIYDGLSLHAWNDAQLADLQNELDHLDFLADYQLVMRGEAIGMVMPDYDRLKIDRTRLKTTFKQIHQIQPKLEFHDFFPDLWPDGWFDELKAQIVSFDLQSVDFVDAKKRIVFPPTIESWESEVLRRQNRWNAHAFWNIYFTSAAPLRTIAVRNFAYSQVRTDETLIVCALERYRLAHGVYPSTLDTLVPAYAFSLPHDIMIGQPYHYRLQHNGTFLLYSVGWNQKDDGGRFIPEEGRTGAPDSVQGDWVWPTPSLARANP